MTDTTTKCYLPSSRVRLLDGEEYTFRQLPINERTLDLFEAFEGGGVGAMRALLAILRESLAHDQDKATVDRLLESGALPMTAKGPGKEVFEAALNAAVPRDDEGEQA